MKNMSRIFSVMVSLCVMVGCQQAADNVPEVSPFTSTRDLKTDRLDQCEVVAQTLSEENDRLKGEVEMLKAKMEAIHEIDETESDESNESHSRSRGLRSRRGASCDAGTLAAWACAPQCIFKLKGLCGLSLKSICHC